MACGEVDRGEMRDGEANHGEKQPVELSHGEVGFGMKNQQETGRDVGRWTRWLLWLQHHHCGHLPFPGRRAEPLGLPVGPSSSPQPILRALGAQTRPECGPSALSRTAPTLGWVCPGCSRSLTLFLRPQESFSEHLGFTGGIVQG